MNDDLEAGIKIPSFGFVLITYSKHRPKELCLQITDGTESKLTWIPLTEDKNGPQQT